MKTICIAILVFVIIRVIRAVVRYGSPTLGERHVAMKNEPGLRFQHWQRPGRVSPMSPSPLPLYIPIPDDTRSA
jgi:hypothetical protein